MQTLEAPGEDAVLVLVIVGVVIAAGEVHES